ncbi:yrdC domain-containing protein, mitochondrial-like [Pecten maximus]|uniref:yrdC domain-containing protein, mitochondrial-like n=1 Tax=Pecten maximus TaxID=6579 RepID=UPI0014585D8A|nr:yrdC domain-containing protein, mitochondrial-like [Pecten maximus]
MVLFKYSLNILKKSTPCGISAIMAKVVDINNHDLQHVVALATQSLKAGNIIAVPTDTIYGVAGLAQRNDATSRIYQLKNRDLKKPIAISVADIDDVYKWGHVTVSRELLTELLPGPVTVVFRRKDELSPSLNPDVHLIGIRIPDQQFIRSLARACQEPIALTSANISSAPSTVSVEEFSELWPMLDLVVDGGMLGNTTESRQGSTVVDLSQTGVYRIIRDGSALRPTSDLLERHGLKNGKMLDSSVDAAGTER